MQFEKWIWSEKEKSQHWHRERTERMQAFMCDTFTHPASSPCRLPKPPFVLPAFPFILVGHIKSLYGLSVVTHCSNFLLFFTWNPLSLPLSVSLSLRKPINSDFWILSCDIAPTLAVSTRERQRKKTENWMGKWTRGGYLSTWFAMMMIMIWKWYTMMMMMMMIMICPCFPCLW